ncbi:glucan biosynthesis protein [Pikeienuella piscinae]|uniref:glucan biosynthesis protein n=1 Tax=Pikeienuella piscinae TaxID=2748098 RepID=UPI001BA5EBDC|nr:glucan biosynthesis protein G [Pikeienuella piscinae]
MNRRRFLGALSALPLNRLFAANAAEAAEAEPFGRTTVVERARALASAPFAWPEPALPDSMKGLSYSEYQGIRFREDRRLFANPPSGFSVDLFHSGFIFNVPVEIFLVSEGEAAKLEYTPDLFTFQFTDPPAADIPLEFAGFRARTELNQPGVMDEFLVFAGASYFRAVAKNQIYGLSARGLAINTGDPEGEEFPFFRAFWLERPRDGRMVVHALLDSPSVSGAYRFTIRPGETTQMDVEMTLIARKEIHHLGIAPMTSMFLFNAKDRFGHDDYRPSIHDSDGLAIWNGGDERIWRPLVNPQRLQASAFTDTGPRGFGLIQREKRFSEYEDLEALYHKRPSLWVEPIGDWGAGAVNLLEIPTKEEIHDNIVAYWRPDEPLAEKSETDFTYRLTWGADAPPADVKRLRVVRTLEGVGTGEGSRRFTIDFAALDATPGDASAAEGLAPVITASEGEIQNAVFMSNPEIGGARIAFQLAYGSAKVVDLRASLVRGDAAASEVWIFRWVA